MEIKHSMRYVKREDPEYPSVLNQYERMPAGLYVIGTLPDPGKKSAAIIGARKCSSYGYSEAKRFGKILAQHGVQIISGLAYGCDAAGHEGALEGNGRTWAVLGSGADVCYPRANERIYEQILEQGGGILSEYEPGAKPEPWHFPIRNRIISALSDVILVVEARKKSGSLITVEYALEQGKSVFAVPGRNRDPVSSGCNRLIADGAGIALNPEDLLEEIGIREKQQADDDKHAQEQSGGEAKRLIASVLDFDEKNIHTIAEEAGCSPSEAEKHMMSLCIKGIAREILPGYFCKN